MRLINVQTRVNLTNEFQDEQRLSELAGRLGLLENQNRQTMEIVFGLKNQVNKKLNAHLISFFTYQISGENCMSRFTENKC